MHDPLSPLFYCSMYSIQASWVPVSLSDSVARTYKFPAIIEKSVCTLYAEHDTGLRQISLNLSPMFVADRLLTNSANRATALLTIRTYKSICTNYHILLHYWLVHKLLLCAAFSGQLKLYMDMVC